MFEIKNIHMIMTTNKDFGHPLRRADEGPLPKM